MPRGACLAERLAVRGQRLWDGPAGHDPLGWLASDLGDDVVVAVVVQQRDAFSFRDCSDKQAREADRAHAPTAPQSSLDIKCAPPVLVVGGEPFVAGVAVSSLLVEFRT